MMFLEKVLQVWDGCRETENFSPFVDSVKTAISAGINYGEISGVSNTKTFNSILSAACSEHYPTLVQKTVLDLIQFLGSNVSMRYRLIHSFLILKTLIYGLSSKPAGPDQLRLLKLVQLFTVDLHHLCPNLEPELFTYALKCTLRVIGQNKQDQFLEPALGVLSNLSRFTDLVHKHLSKKSDFERLRKCLLHIMSSDTVSQSSLVFSMAVRFYLWKASDKFFDGLNVHKTVQVLFNLLLNGEIDLGGLCAGDLLSDLCTEPAIMRLVASFPELKDCIKEIMIQLKSKNTSLILKLIHLLYRLMENKTSPEIGQYIRTLVFHTESVDTVENDANKPTVKNATDPERGAAGFDPLGILFNLSTGNDDLIASAALDFLLYLTTKLDSEGTELTLYELLLEHIMEGTRKLGSSVTSVRPDGHSASVAIDPAMCGCLLRLSLFVRLAEDIVRHLQTYSGNTESTCPGLTNSAVVIDHLSLLAEFLHQTIVIQLDNNPLLRLFAQSNGSTDPVAQLALSNRPFQMEMNSCLVSASVILEAMGLIHAIAELLSTTGSPVSQDEEVSATQPTEMEDDGSVTRLGVNKAIETVARQCGQSLQSLLERTEVCGLFALGLVTTSPHLPMPWLLDKKMCMPLGMGPVSRRAVIRLLSTALHWDGFDNDQFIYQLNRLQSGHAASGSNLAELLECISNCPNSTVNKSSGSPYPSTPAFLARWIHSVVGGYPAPVTSSHATPSVSAAPTNLFESTSPTSVTDTLVNRVDQVLQRWENEQDQTQLSAHASDILTLLEYKIQVFKSREDVLEASAFANAEALASAQRLAEHYRQRLAMTEAESSHLRALQLNALARLEADKQALLAYAEQLKKSNAELENVRARLAQSEEEYAEMVAKNDTLQSKLNAAREQNRAMDLTIDDYRTQLDQAKEQIQSQTTQIAKFTQITRLINDLTGNPSADVTTVSLASAGDTGNNTSRTNGTVTTLGTDSVSPVSDAVPVTHAAVTRRMTTTRGSRR